MSAIENSTQRSGFFPGNNKDIRTRGPSGPGSNQLSRNSSERKTEIDQITKDDVKVDIPDSIKDFARIKGAVDAAPSIDNSAKIADLKKRIENGTYSVDYDALADKILTNEF